MADTPVPVVVGGKEWTPSSWRALPIKQQPEYKDKDSLGRSLAKVHSLPPIIHQNEIKQLKADLAAACRGEKFLLQGGDCAERFLDCNKTAIESKFYILLQMSLVMLWGARVPIVRVSRLAGQFAKPRSSPTEMVNGKEVSSFKGDNVNSFDSNDREPDPNRLVLAYFHSVATINYLRAMVAGGVADIHDPSKWNLSHIKKADVREEYSGVVKSIVDGFKFLSIFHADTADVLKRVDIFTSHEGLLLNYEEALTEKANGGYYNLGAHFLWIGDRTRQINGAHIEYFRGISNPIGVKVGPSMKADELIELVTLLNPNKEEGRLTLITRYGAKKIHEFLPEHIKAVQQTGIPVLWCCDPCHGNTEVIDGIKTRRFETMAEEIVQAFKIHAENGSRLGGVHLELTGDDVTECVGGADHTSDLSSSYTTYCDPRLNYTQSLDIAFTITRELAKYYTSTHRL